MRQRCAQLGFENQNCMIKNISVILAIVFFLLVTVSYGQSRQYKSISKKEQRNFIAHFNCLDSCASSNPTDTIYGCCKQSIDFMVTRTKIEITPDVTSFIGRTSFTRTDLENWHSWFLKRNRKRETNKHKLQFKYAHNITFMQCAGK